MQLVHLRLQNFRNHVDSSFDFGTGANLLLGNNGQGKTNIIEAISYLCLTKSFYATNDVHALNFGKEIFEVEGNIVLERGLPCTLRVAYSHEENKKVFTQNRRHVEPFSTVIGKFPIVISSPEYTPTTTAGPAERRRFVDFVISQSNVLYFQHLMEYRRVLRHRNKILFEARIARREPGILTEPWDEQMITLGSSITYRRSKFIEEFQDYVSSAYHHLIGMEEEPSIEYQPMIKLPRELMEHDIRTMYRDLLREQRSNELRFGTSLVGPHRDEFLLKINGIDLRKFASQGQHKTFLVALKIGEFFYLKDRCNETPIVLLDDVFSELDEHRAEHLLAFVRDLNQTFITSTNLHLFEGRLSFGDQDRRFHIQNGSVVQQHAMTVS